MYEGRFAAETGSPQKGLEDDYGFPKYINQTGIKVPAEVRHSLHNGTFNLKEAIESAGAPYALNQVERREMTK